MKRADAADAFALVLKAHGYMNFEREARLVPGRRYRWDFAHRDLRIAIEIQGATYVKGAHSTGAGIRRDAEKLNAVVLEGYRPLLFTTDMLHGPALADSLETIRQLALRAEEER